MSIAVLLGAAAGACAAAAIVEWLGACRQPRSRSARDRASGGGGTLLSHLGAMTVLLARIARRAGMRAAPGDLEARIAAAGAPLGLVVGDVVALKGAAALGLTLLVLPVAGELPGRLGIAALLAAPIAGFFAPQLVLARRARSRGRAIAAELPDVLDLLRVAIGAGLPVGHAIGEVGRRMSGVLAGELDGAAARIQLGAAHGDALRELVARCPARGVATLAAAISRAELHGAPLTPALEALAAEARAEHARGLRDAAARAAPKIQLVVALVLVPAVMLLIGAVLVQGLST